MVCCKIYSYICIYGFEYPNNRNLYNRGDIWSMLIYHSEDTFFNTCYHSNGPLHLTFCSYVVRVNLFCVAVTEDKLNCMTNLPLRQDHSVPF